MKLFKTGLHVLIAAVSVTAFLGEWVALAHSLKPVQPSPSLEALPALPPIQTTFDNGNSSSSTGDFGFQVLTPSRRSRGFGGGFMTGGS